MIKNFLVVITAFLLFCGCNSNTKTNDALLRDFTFEPVKGIKYEEVRRRFSNGLSFNEDGFMQKPSWIIQIVAEDSILAYSPQKKIMQGFHLHYDHGNVYNFAEEWFKVKHISKDSLILQRVQVTAKVIASDVRSDVNMTFYAQSYIKNKLKTTASVLQKPTVKDTIFIKNRSAEINKNIDSAYAATEPVVFTPLTKNVTVEKISTVDKLSNRTAAYDYMYPQYKIMINKAYKEFAHQFSAIIDYSGKIKVKNVYGVMPADMEQRKKVIQTVADYYLKTQFKITPGKTLDIPHNTEITITLVGKMNQTT
jgi:hypothetical protein